VRLEYKPFFLWPDIPEEGQPLPAHIVARHKDPNDPLKLRAAREGLIMKHRPTVPNTRRAHEAAEYARSQGKFEPFHAELLKRYWSQEEDLHDFAVLRAAASTVGLDPAETQSAVEEGRFTEAVEASVQEAYELGIHGIPTFVFERRFAVQGAQEAPIFKLAMERLGVARKG
jgi:predicted DsbA family dithiol-disulfide isomerase